jgi:hypothetical protein
VNELTFDENKTRLWRVCCQSVVIAVKNVARKKGTESAARERTYRLKNVPKGLMILEIPRRA